MNINPLFEESRKAFLAAAMAATISLGPKLSTGPTKEDFALALGLAIFAFVGVWLMPNKAKAQ